MFTNTLAAMLSHAQHMKDADHVPEFVCTLHLSSLKRDLIYGFRPQMTCTNLTHVTDSFRVTSPNSFQDVMQ